MAQRSEALLLNAAGVIRAWL